MLEQVSTAVTFFAYFSESKVGKTGLTVTVDVRKIKPDGTNSEIVTAGSATETGDGVYFYTLASGSTADEGVYVAIFKTATTSVDQQHVIDRCYVGKAGVEYNVDVTRLAVPGSAANGELGFALGRIAASAVNVIAPIAQGSKITLIQGDDYLGTDSRQLEFGEPSTGWPVLTGANIAFYAEMQGAPSTNISKSGNADTDGHRCKVVIATGTGLKKISVEFARTELTSLLAPAGTWTYNIRATLSGGNVVSLAGGYLVVATTAAVFGVN